MPGQLPLVNKAVLLRTNCDVEMKWWSRPNEMVMVMCDDAVVKRSTRNGGWWLDDNAKSQSLF
jgi:hypothetical protein